jgi:protein-tyrosine phosphatase
MLPDQPTSRYLRWDVCANVRELGGHATTDGATTRWGSLVRGDSVGRLNEKGCAALEAYGIRTIIDLRIGVEARDEPSPLLCHATIVSHHLPLNPNDRAVSKATSALRDSPLPYMATVNAAFLAESQPQIAAIMRAIVTAPEGGVLFHCHAGRDRTGLITALLLALADVPAASIVEDYTLSFGATADTMDATLTHLEDTYGGVTAYLCATGMTADEIAALRQRLRTDGSPV